jgi:hypothetical protein
MYILNTWSKDKGHKFEVVKELPEGAVRDNWIALDDEMFSIYATRDVPAFGRSFAADLWGQYLVEHDDEFEKVWNELHPADEIDRPAEAEIKDEH